MTLVYFTALTTQASDISYADYPIQSVPFTAVQVKDAFWAPRIEINRLVTIPYAFEDDTLYVNLFVAGQGEVDMGGRTCRSDAK